MDELKKIFASSLLFLFFFLTSCNVKTSSETFNFERDTPAWLKEKIGSIANSTGHYYNLTKIYRYDRDESFVYHFSIPLSSCIYCELYDKDGNKLQGFNDSTLKEILRNREGEILIWENKK